MKKFTVVLLAGILAMGLAGCSLETEKAPEEQTSVSVAGENKDMETKPESDTQVDTGRKVGISYAEVSAGFNVSQAEAFEKIGKDYGYQVTLLNADNNVEKQVADVEDLIAQGMDVIFFNPVDSSACSTVMDKVKAAGIDMVVFNAKADGYEPGPDYLFLGIGECYDQGAEVARWVSQNYKNEGTMRILHLTGSMSQSWSLDRGQGFVETIEAERPDHEFVSTQCANCSRIDAQQMTLNVLQATQGGVDVIYAHNDEMILGAIAAVKEFGLEPGKDVMTCGIDLSMEMCESILDGELSSCLIIDPEAIVYGLYDNYTKYLEGEDYPKITGLKLRMCDPGNAQDELDSGKIIF